MTKGECSVCGADDVDIVQSAELDASPKKWCVYCYELTVASNMDTYQTPSAIDVFRLVIQAFHIFERRQKDALHAISRSKR